MRLSAEMYQQIVEGLKSDSHRDKDKRREPRVGLAGEAEFVTVNEFGKRIAGMVKVRDVSRSGVGLLFSQQFPSHQRFVVQLPSNNGEPLWLVCITSYCRATELGRFSVGAKILQVLNSEEIQKVEAKAAAGSLVAAAKQPARRSTHDEQADIARIAKAILE